ncbi:unnamed protein product, partial [Cyprideis torosa]
VTPLFDVGNYEAGLTALAVLREPVDEFFDGVMVMADDVALKNNRIALLKQTTVVKLVILDRDGVINEDSDDYIKSTDEWIPIPGSLEAITRLNTAGFVVAVATNQSGVGRGYFDREALEGMHNKLSGLLADLGGHVDYMTYCPHAPDEACLCRKPLPGMYQEIARKFNTSLEGVWVIGDSLRDLQAAVAVAAQPVLVKTGKGLRSMEQVDLPPNTFIFDDLLAAAKALISEDTLHV